MARVRTIRARKHILEREFGWEFEYLHTPLGAGSAQDVFEAEVDETAFLTAMDGVHFTCTPKDPGEIYLDRCYIAAYTRSESDE